MRPKLFVNLSVSNLTRAIAFYEAIGAVNNPKFTDETAACMVFSEEIFVMLLTEDKWKFFTKKPLVDSKRSSEVMLAYSCEDRKSVENMINSAIRAGAKIDIIPPQDHGFMFSRSFEDLDGHIWEIFWMDNVNQ
jgi:predicted lactoylglutathione lyase